MGDYQTGKLTGALDGQSFISPLSCYKVLIMRLMESLAMGVNLTSSLPPLPQGQDEWIFPP